VMNDFQQGDVSDISVFKDIELTLPLLDPVVLFEQMEEAGIEKSILYAVDAPMVTASNEYVAMLVAKAPEKLIGFASVNPLKPNAVEILEHAVKDLGLKGLKLHPPLQNFYPNDKACFPLYKKAQELGIPIVFHVGSTPFGSLVKLGTANPMLLDEVACAFPKLNIIMTHLGTLWDKEAFMVVEKNPNVFIDTAAYLYEIPQIINSDLIHRIGENKLIFGTDYPMPFAGKRHEMKDFVEAIKNLDISNELKQKIFFENISNLLK